MKQDQYSMRGGRKEIFEILNNPGPGQYESLSPRSRATKIKEDYNPKATYCSRIPYRKVPGPGDYNHSVIFGSSMRNFTDLKPVFTGNKFSCGPRKVFDASSSQYTPGPGEYQAPSAFSQYMDKSAYSSKFAMEQAASHTSLSSNGGGGSKRTRSSKGRYSKLNLTLNP